VDLPVFASRDLTSVFTVFTLIGVDDVISLINIAVSQPVKSLVCLY